MSNEKVKFSPSRVVKMMRAQASRLENQCSLFKKMGYIENELIVVEQLNPEMGGTETSVVPMSIVDDGSAAAD